MQRIINLIPERLKWLLFWLLRPKYTVGVFVAVFDHEDCGDFILLVKKRLGVAGTKGLTVPGGGKKYHQTIENAAVDELSEETGLRVKPSDLRLLRFYAKPPSRDIVILFLYTGSCPIDFSNFRASIEIESVQLVNVITVGRDVDVAHLEMVQDAYEFWKANVLRLRTDGDFIIT